MIKKGVEHQFHPFFFAFFYCFFALHTRTMKKWTLLLSFLVTICSLQAQVIYVNTQTGDDSFSGTSATVAGTDGPKKTIAAGVAAAEEGSILSVQSGVYDENVLVEKSLVWVKTGAGAVSLSGITFGSEALVLPNKPTSEAFASEQVTILPGASIQDGILFTKVGGVLYVNEGGYSEFLNFNKELLFYTLGDVETSGLRLSLNGGVVSLAGRLFVRETLEVNQINGGFFELSDGSLVVRENGIVSPGSNGSFIRTSGSGALILENPSETSILPIGTGNVYTPLLFTNLSCERINANVRSANNTNSFNPDLPVGVNSFVGLEWKVSLSGQSGETNVRFDYTGLNELGDWASAQNRVVAYNSGTSWTEGSNIQIGQSFASASFSNLEGGTLAIYSDFPNSTGATPEQGITVFPVPFSNTLQIQLDNPAAMQYTLTDISGKVVATGNTTNTPVIATEGLASGVYALTVFSNEASYRRLVVKQ